jgi:hypothetical protein
MPAPLWGARREFLVEIIFPWSSRYSLQQSLNERSLVSTNPWLTIALADYEGHMESPEVDQSALLSELFGATLTRHRPRSLVVLGCAGGNGFDQIDPVVTERIFAIDINPAYTSETFKRYQSRLPGLRALTLDIQTGAVPATPVDLVHAGLVLEYVDVPCVIPKIASILVRGGTFHAVLQLPSNSMPSVSTTRFTSLQRLTPWMRLVSPDELTTVAFEANLVLRNKEFAQSRAGKMFAVLTFERI